MGVVRMTQVLNLHGRTCRHHSRPYFDIQSSNVCSVAKDFSSLEKEKKAGFYNIIHGHGKFRSIFCA